MGSVDSKGSKNRLKICRRHGKGSGFVPFFTGVYETQMTSRIVESIEI